jgi:hypothetical protein
MIHGDIYFFLYLEFYKKFGMEIVDCSKKTKNNTKTTKYTKIYKNGADYRSLGM